MPWPAEGDGEAVCSFVSPPSSVKRNKMYGFISYGFSVKPKEGPEHDSSAFFNRAGGSWRNSSIVQLSSVNVTVTRSLPTPPGPPSPVEQIGTKFYFLLFTPLKPSPPPHWDIPLKYHFKNLAI